MSRSNFFANIPTSGEIARFRPSYSNLRLVPRDTCALPSCEAFHTRSSVILGTWGMLFIIFRFFFVSPLTLMTTLQHCTETSILFCSKAWFSDSFYSFRATPAGKEKKYFLLTPIMSSRQVTCSLLLSPAFFFVGKHQHWEIQLSSTCWSFHLSTGISLMLLALLIPYPVNSSSPEFSHNHIHSLPYISWHTGV